MKKFAIALFAMLVGLQPVLAGQFTIPTDTMTSKTARWNTATPSWSTSGGHIVQAPLTPQSYYFLSMDDVGSVSGNTEILVQLRSTSTSGEQLGLVVNGSTSDTTGYYVALSGTISFISRMDTGNSSNFLDFPTIAMSADTDYWMLLQYVDSSDTIRFKFWSGAATDEPGSWTGSVTDSTYTSGYVGLFARHESGTRTWKYIGVGTSGDPAPRPGGSNAPSTGIILQLSQ